MSNFKFDLEDLTNDNDDALLREIHKDNAKPLTTTRSNQGGDPGRLSVLSMGQIMMGVPLYNTGSDVSKIQELTFTHLLTGAIVDPKGEGTGTLNIKGFNTEQLIPADVLADAKAIGAKLAAERPKNTAGTGGDGANYGGLPADVVASEAFKHTSLTGPHIEKFVYLLLQQQGDTYSQASRGITDDPNPSSFDCSGLVWWGTNQLIRGAEGMPNVSNAQFAYFADRGTEITLDQGIRSPGALLFHFTAVGNQEGHVSTSLGNGTHMGAQGTDTGVVIDGVDGYKFNKACLMSMFNYHGIPPPVAPVTAGVGAPVSGAGADTFSGQNGSQGPRMAWALIFLKGLGVAVALNNIISVVAWEMGENTNAQYNPLATTQRWPGSTNFNSNGGSPVQNYASPDDGFNATIKTITNGFYDNVLRDLQANAAPEQTMGHFSGGPSGGQDLNTWGTGPNGYSDLSAARQVVNDFIALITH